MSVLERDQNVTVLHPAGRFNPRLSGLALLYGAIGAVALALVLLVPTLVAWMADSRSSVSWLAAMSFAGDGWVLAHHGHLRAPAGGVTHVITFAPLLFTGLAAWFARAAAKPLLREVEQEGRSAGRWWHAPMFFVLGYLGAGLLLALLGMTGPATPGILSVIPGAVVIAAVGFGWALRAEPELAAYAGCARQWERLPAAVRRGVRPAVEAAGVLFAIALVAVVVLLIVHVSRVGQVNGLLSAGTVGTLVLALAQLASAPNIVLLVTGWFSGASVHVGTATIAAGSVQSGLVPSIPVLGAAPDPGGLPLWVRAAPVIVVLVGALAGYRAANGFSALTGLKAKLTCAAGAAGILTLGVAFLIWLAGAQVSAAPLAQAHVSPMVLPLFAVEIAAGALAAATVTHYLQARRSQL